MDTYYNFYANMPSQFKNQYTDIFNPKSSFNDLQLFQHIEVHKNSEKAPFINPYYKEPSRKKVKGLIKDDE